MTEEELKRLRDRREELGVRIGALEKERFAVIGMLVIESLRRRIVSPLKHIVGDDGEDYGEESPFDFEEIEVLDGVQEGRFVATFYWKCPDEERNVLRYCIYDDVKDPCHDFCFFCHEPEERK